MGRRACAVPTLCTSALKESARGGGKRPAGAASFRQQSIRAAGRDPAPGVVGVRPVLWEGEALTRTAHETFDSRTCAATSRQHSVLVWFALQFVNRFEWIRVSPA